MESSRKGKRQKAWAAAARNNKQQPAVESVYLYAAYLCICGSPYNPTWVGRAVESHFVRAVAPVLVPTSSKRPGPPQKPPIYFLDAL